MSECSPQEVYAPPGRSHLLIVSKYIVWYAVIAFAGWVFECILNVVREGAWENRGFLFGPSCPIYGVGAVLFLIAYDNAYVASGAFPLWAVFLTAMIGSAVLEYLTSVAMEKLFGARWWDYSNMPLNINGRVCLPASLLFGAAGVATAVLLVPLTHAAYELIPDPVWEIAAIVIVAVVAVDATLAFSALTELLQKVEAAADAFDKTMEANVATAQASRRKVAGAARSSMERATFSFRLLNTLTFGRVTSKLPARKDKIEPAASDFVEQLNARQRRVLASIKGFSNAKASKLGEAGRKAIHAARAKVAEKARSKR